MTIHVSTSATDYFVHSDEIRQLQATDNEIIVNLRQPVGAKNTYVGGKDKIFISTSESADMHKMILDAINADKNISIQVKSFQII